VRRSALVRRLMGASESAMVTVVAPPGYGKSTLLGEWARRDHRRFLWLSVDECRGGELSSTVAAMRELFATSGWLDPSSGPGDGATETVAELMGLVRGSGPGFVLVIDDAHRIAPTVLRDVVGAMLEELPLGSTIALGSRSEPAIPVGRLRASQDLTEIRMQDLRMTVPEARTLLRRAGLELSTEAVETLTRETEGWPAGLYLAGLSLRSAPEPIEALARFGGDDHRIAEYFRDEVLSVLPPDLLSFSTSSSVLDELSGPMCDYVLEQEGSALTLVELAVANPLLQPLDPARERYAWHRMFRDALRAELRRNSPGLERRLHHRASCWYESSGDTDRAIAHAVAARDRVRAGDLLWANIVDYIARGRNATVRRWLGSFGPAEVADYAPLALAAAHSVLVAGDVDQARHWAAAAAAARDRRRTGRAAKSLTAGLAGIEAMIARSGATGMAEAAARGYEQEAADSPWRPVCLFLRGTALHLTGDRAGARAALEDAIELSAVAAPSVMSLALAQTAMISIEQQDWDEAAELTDRAERVLRESELASDPMSALVFASCAASRAHHGRIDEAKRDVRAGVDLLATLGDFVSWYGAEARILLAHASLWLADVIAARALLAEASRLARRTPDATIFAHWFDEAWAQMDTLAETSLAGPSSLTIAELRVLRFLPSHRSFREIAQQLGVSANTVKTQAHAVYRKLGVASRSEAVGRASEAGLLGQ
jgi:LuxR family transcriptional regulator, maltose regulon positive regulatory protein